MSSGADILERVLLDCQHSLNVQDLTLCLRAAGVLTDDDRTVANVDPEDPSGNAVVVLIGALKRKGPHCANMLLTALEQAVDGSSASHKHIQLIDRLQQELTVAGLLKGGVGIYQAQNALSTEPAGDQNGLPFFPSAIPDWPSGDPPGRTAIPNPGHLVCKSNGNRQIVGHKVAAENWSDDQLLMSSKVPVPLMKYKYMSSPVDRRSSSDDLRCMLVRESKAIRRHFTDFVLNVCDLLERCPTVTVDNVRLCLLHFGCYRSHDSSPLKQAGTIAGLLAALYEYSSWFNYDLVSYLVERFGGHEGKRLVQVYESQLKQYFQRLVFQCPPFSHDEEGIPRGFEQLEVMINWNFKTCSLQDVAVLKCTLCSLLQLQPHSLLLRAVDDRCMMSWAIPVKAVPHAIQRTTAKTEAFSKEDILSLRVGAKVVDFPARDSKSKHSPKDQRSLSTHSHLQQDTSLSSYRSNERVFSTTGESSAASNASSPSSSLLIVQKSLPTLACTPHQAYGTHTTSYQPRTSTKLAAKESLSHYSCSPKASPSTPKEASLPDDNSLIVQIKRKPRSTTPPALLVLGLLQSPVLRRHLYFQFHYTGHDCLMPAQQDVASTTEAEVYSSPQGPAAETGNPKVKAVARADPSQVEMNSGSNHQCPSSSIEQPSPARSRQSITARRFESQSSVIEGPQSPSIVSINPHTSTPKRAINAGAEAASNAPHSHSPQAASNDMTHMDMMLSAASEARARRGRRKRRTIQEITTTPLDIQTPLHNIDAKESLQTSVKGGSVERILQEHSTNANSASIDSLPARCLSESPVASSTPQTQRNPLEIKDSEQVGKSSETLTSQSFIHDTAASLEPSNSSTTCISDLIADTTTTWSTPRTQSLQSIPAFHSPEPLEAPEPGKQQPTQRTSPPFTTSHETARHSSTSAQACKSVGFLWRLLGRANATWPARLCVAAIQTTHFCRRGELLVRRGQQLQAMYRISDKVYVKSVQGDTGFVPYQSIRVSRKIYTSSSKTVQLSYSQLYLHSPDGVDTRAATNLQSPHPSIEMVAIQEIMPTSREDLTVSCGDRILVLYCDDEWVYGITEDRAAGFLPRSACRLTRKFQTLYQNWINSETPFQADFVVKFNEPPPPILRRNVLRKPTSLTSLSANNSKVGKIMTVARSYAPFIGTSQLTICKGLQVKVLKSDSDFFSVVTKSGSSFWIPSAYLRPACKGDSFSGLAPLVTVSADSLLIDRNTHTLQRAQTSGAHSQSDVDQVQNSYEPISPLAASVPSPQQQPGMNEHSIVI